VTTVHVATKKLPLLRDGQIEGRIPGEPEDFGGCSAKSLLSNLQRLPAITAPLG
jgi:hypothetical protein